MAINITDFDKIWASTSPLTPYSFTDANYQEGWNFIGATPPARQMWDFLQKNNDEKAQFLADAMFKGNPLTLTADDGNGNSVSLVGNPNGAITWNGKELERINASGTDYIRYESGLQICWGTCAGSGDGDGSPVTFGAAFISTPAITCTAGYQTATASNHVSIQLRNASATGFNCVVSVNTSFTTGGCRYIAIGYWK